MRRRERVLAPAGPIDLPERRLRGMARDPADQLLRNQSVGSTCSAAASGPRLAAVIWIRMSSGAALAYSTKTSK